MKPLVIIQPLFMGDIFFCMKIAAVAAAKGHRVLFPIHDQYVDVRDSLVMPENVHMPLMSSDFELKHEYHQINLMCENASASGDFQYHQGPIETSNAFYLALNSSWRKTKEVQTMRLKYEIAGVDYRDWADYVRIHRRHDKEAALNKLLGIGQTPFVLLNERGRMNYMPVPITGGSVIRMDIIPGYRLFDWCGIIESASEIITIDTALVLLVEVLKPKATLQIFSRYVPGDNFKQLSAVLRLKWNFANSISDLIRNHDLVVWSSVDS